MAPHLDVAGVRRSLLVYLVGRSAALPLFLYLGYVAINDAGTLWPGAVVMANGVLGLALVLLAYRGVGTPVPSKPESLLLVLAGVDASSLLVLWISPILVLALVTGLLLFFLVIDLFASWTVRTARESRT